jgi:hypothetical protein
MRGVSVVLFPRKNIPGRGAVGGQVRAVCSEHPKLCDHLVVELELAPVSAHAALIGDDRRVLGVGLSSPR